MNRKNGELLARFGRILTETLVREIKQDLEKDLAKVVGDVVEKRIRKIKHECSMTQHTDGSTTIKLG